VSRWSYSPSSAVTTIEIDGWPTPTGGEDGGASGGGGSSRPGGNPVRQQSREHGRAEQRRTRTQSRRGGGRAKPKTGRVDAVPVRSESRAIVASVTGKVAGQFGRYTGAMLSGATKRDASGNLVAGDFGGDSVPCVIWHLPDVSTHSHSLRTSPASTVMGFSIGVNTADGKPIVVAVGATMELIVVDLVKDGGTAGDRTNKATFTYTVKRRGVNMATARPLLMQRSVGKMTEATIGLAIVKDDLTIGLLWADETPDVGDC
jgi:hypothetical protein